MEQGELVVLSEVRTALMARKSNAERVDEIADDMPRSIRLPRKVWEALDEDAGRCKRSSVRQLEALLTLFYKLGDIDIDEAALEQTRRELRTHEPTSARRR